MRTTQTAALLAICGIFANTAIARVLSRDNVPVPDEVCCTPGCEHCALRKCGPGNECTAFIWNTCCAIGFVQAKNAQFYDDDLNPVNVTYGP